MKILTISIAAYNMEKYIRQALDSLIDQRVIDELEVFVVDDGGTDTTLDIAKEYAERYPRSIIPVHKENGGYGTTVNYSIAHATGKYFKLLDGDDWFDVEALCRIVEALRETDADVIFSPYRMVYHGNDGSVDHTCIRTLAGYVNGSEIPLDGSERLPGMWGIIYRTDALKRSGIVLPSHALYTDTIYSIVPLAFCRDAMFLDVCLYQYRIGREGQSVSRTSYVRHAEDGKKTVRSTCRFYEQSKARSHQNRDCVRRQIANQYCSVAKMILLAPVCGETLRRLKAYEAEIRALSPDVYKLTARQGKRGLFLWLCRRTNYAAYWLLKLIPGGFPNRI